MADKKYYWLKLKDDFFRQKEIKKLRKIAGGDTYTIIYLKMQLLSLKNEGKLYFEGIEKTFAEELALELDEDVENVTITIAYLQQHNLIETTIQDEYLLCETVECIGKEGTSAERVRKHRENKQLLERKTLQCNTQVTNCNTEIEKEKDIDIEKEIKKDKKKSVTAFDDLIDKYTNNEELKRNINEYIEMRIKKKAKPTSRALELIFKDLDKYSNNYDTLKIQILENSIKNNWTGVFELKGDKRYGTTGTNNDADTWNGYDLKKNRGKIDTNAVIDETGIF